MCPACQGERCPLLTRCPYEEVPAEVWDFLALCDDAEHGLMPVAGGVLDQCAAFNVGRRIVRADTAYFKHPVKDG